MPQLGQKRGCALRPCSSGRPLPAKRAATEQAVSLFGGVQNVKVPGGDRFSCGATLFRWACECTDKSVPFGKYCLSRPLVFSLDPRCHGLCGLSRLFRGARPSVEMPTFCDPHAELAAPPGIQTCRVVGPKSPRVHRCE